VSNQKLTIEKIVILDARIPENLDLIKLALSKTKWLEKYSQDIEKITLSVLERLYEKIVEKYDAQIAYIQPAGDNSWVIMIKNNKTHAWITTVYSKTLFEGMAKAILALYGYLVKGINFKK